MTPFEVCLGYLCKEAEEAAESKKKRPWVEGAKVMGKSLAGLGLGYVAGAGAGKLMEKVTKGRGGNPEDLARKVAPLAGGAAGLIYPIWKAREKKEIQDAVESAHNQSDERVSGK